jgi:DNA-binding NarL/FixJ family response regulator
MKSDHTRRAVVVIEDSDEDYEVTVWALRLAGLGNPVHRCRTAAAIDRLLAGRAGWPNALRAAYPALVLLDLNLPGMEWRDTLGQLRADSLWRTVPVVVVSTSWQPSEVSDTYGLGAAGYLLKPLDLDAFAAAIGRVIAYWFDTVLLPVPAGA